MARFHPKHTFSTKIITIIFLSLSTFIAIAFIGNHIFHSSAHLSITSNWLDIPYNTTITPPPHKQHVVKNKTPQRFLSATFADLPAPQWNWEQMDSAPVPRLDGYAIQIQNLFYVFSGYANLDHVSIIFLSLLYLISNNDDSPCV